MHLHRDCLGILAALLCLAVGGAADAEGRYSAQQLCALWAAEYSFPSGIAQERCRTNFPELAMDYGAYCSRLKAEGVGHALTLAACLSYKDARRPG
jgi:hypothetical protein